MYMIDFFKNVILKILHAKKECMVLLISGLAFFIVIMTDRAYHERTDLFLFVWVIKKLREYVKPLGFSYSAANGILSSSFGILITGISIILTIGIQLANRSENKIYGVQRKELNFSNVEFLYKPISWMVLIMPVIMVIAINLQWCLTGYFVLFCTYVFFVLNYLPYKNSYCREKDIKQIIKKLVKDHKNVDKLKYQMTMNEIRIEAEKEGCWGEVRQMFQFLIEESYQESEKESFLLCNHFFNMVFLECLSENERVVKGREESAIDIVEYYLTKTIDESQENLTLESRQYLIFWSMLCSIFKKCSENSIEQFLEWFMDYRQRGILVTENEEHIIAFSQHHLQTSLVLILLENWLYNNNVSDRQFTWKLSEIWEHGKRMINKENINILKKYTDYYNMIYGGSKEGLLEKIQGLYEDAEKNTGKSMIWHLVNH